MRIAFVVDKFPNISETFVLDEIVGIIRRGIEVDIFALARGRETDVHPAYREFGLLDRTIYCVPNIRSRVGRLLTAVPSTLVMLARNPMAFVKVATTRRAGIQARTFLSLARAFVNAGRTYDVVHAHFGPNGIRAAALRSAGALSAPIITTFHGYDATSFIVKYGISAYRELASLGDCFIAVSESIARALPSIGIPRERTIVASLGVDCEQFSLRPARPEREAIRIMSVGRFVEKKGLEYGIHAVTEARRTCPQIVYDIVGDGMLRPELEALIAELHAESFVHLLGYKNQAELRALLNETDIMLVPSVTAADGDQESMPIVVKEAMASGVPVVASRHAGIGEIVAHNVTGLLADERDVGGLAECLVLLAQDARLRERLRTAGRETIEARFDNECLIDDLARLYRDVRREDRFELACGRKGIDR
jgi:colanic acid/amylovoran biosynthesis glycosyltransferase